MLSLLSPVIVAAFSANAQVPHVHPQIPLLLSQFEVALAVASSEKDTAPIDLSISFRLEDQATPAGWLGTVCLSLTPRADIAHGRVRFVMPETVKVEGAREQELGPLTKEKAYCTTVRVRLPSAGRFEIRGWVESLDAAGQVVFDRSKAVYLVVAEGKVLSGEGSFLTVELRELQRQKDAGEITSEEYQKRSNALMGHRQITPKA